MLHKLPQCSRQIQEPDINMNISIKNSNNRHVINYNIDNLIFLNVITLVNKSMLYLEDINSGTEKKIRQNLLFTELQTQSQIQ
jgi:hypothetical protein